MREKRNRKYLFLDAAVALLLLSLDQATKYLAISRLKGNPAIVLIDGVLELQYVENTGIAFSLFEGRKPLILTMGFLVLAAILFFLFRIPTRKKFRVLHLLLAAVVAGALGNLLDRLRFDFVVDFISFVLIRYPVFNLADCYIVISAAALFFLFLFVYQEEEFRLEI